MREKIEQILKYFPAFTLICYICGFIVYNSFLLQYGIVDTNILNLRFIEAGLLYLIIAPFILATPFIIRTKVNFLGSIFSSLFVFIIYNNIIGRIDLDYLWKAYACVIILNIYSYIILQWYSSDAKRGKFNLTEAPLAFGVIVMLSLLSFSIYYKEIKSNFGGGKSYQKVLILKERNNNLIKTDSLFHTDTLNIIYENNDFIYFKRSTSIISLKKDLIVGEILIK